MTSLANVIKALLHKHLQQWNSNWFWQTWMERSSHCSVTVAVTKHSLLEAVLALAGPSWSKTHCRLIWHSAMSCCQGNSRRREHKVVKLEGFWRKCSEPGCPEVDVAYLWDTMLFYKMSLVISLLLQTNGWHDGFLLLKMPLLLHGFYAN